MLGLSHGQPWPCLALASQAIGSSSVVAEQHQDGTGGSCSFGNSKLGGEFGRRRDGGGRAAWPPHDWERERLEDLEEARCKGGGV